MILGYGVIGLLLASLGGAAPGASNLVVIKTTVNHSLQKGMHVALGAGLGEMLLAFMALCYSSALTQFFEMNLWLQITFTFVFFTVGVLLLFSERLRFVALPKIPKKGVNSQVITGFLLALLNPPVLLFWILAISLSQRHLLPLTNMSPMTILVLFFSGVFIGKVLVLYGYALLGKNIQKKKNTNNSKLNIVIGVLLIVLSTAQGVRFLIS